MAFALPSYAKTLPTATKAERKAAKASLKSQGFKIGKEDDFVLSRYSGGYKIKNCGIIEIFNAQGKKGYADFKGEVIMPPCLDTQDELYPVNDFFKESYLFCRLGSDEYYAADGTFLFKLYGSRYSDMEFRPNPWGGPELVIAKTKDDKEHSTVFRQDGSVVIRLSAEPSHISLSKIAIRSREYIMVTTPRECKIFDTDMNSIIEADPKKSRLYSFDINNRPFFFMRTSGSWESADPYSKTPKYEIDPIIPYVYPQKHEPKFSAVYDEYGTPVYKSDTSFRISKKLPNGYLIISDGPVHYTLLSDEWQPVISATFIKYQPEENVLEVSPKIATCEFTTLKGAKLSDNLKKLTAKEKALIAEHAAPTAKGSLTSPAGGIKLATKALPSLELVDNSIRFHDPSGRNAIEAGGSYTITFQVTNSGSGNAFNCMPRVSTDKAGITIGKMQPIDLKPSETATVTATIKAGDTLADGSAGFSVTVDEPNGFGTASQNITVNAHAFEAPMLVVNDYTITSANGATSLEKKTPFDLQVLLQNIRHGSASNVSVTVKVPQHVYLIEGEERHQFQRLDGGETRSLVYTLVANNNYAASHIPVEILITEKYGKYSENRTIDLEISQPMAARKITVNETARENSEIKIATLNSEIDRDIPSGTTSAPNTFAVIIANENYSQVARVPHAVNDGMIFSQYCQHTWGIPKSNIRLVTDATRNEMTRQLNWLREIGAAYGKEASFIIYYSGHGVPSENDRSSYLMPVDGYHSDMTTNIPLDHFYKTLAEAGAGKVTVFLDACFSGAERGDGMLMAARGVSIKPKTSQPTGQMVVFTASQGDETAYPLQSESHGLFTYYLLKKIRESRGSATLGQLADYVTSEVRKRSVVENSKPQTPAVLVSASLAGAWENTAPY